MVSKKTVPIPVVPMKANTLSTYLPYQASDCREKWPSLITSPQTPCSRSCCLNPLLVAETKKSQQFSQGLDPSDLGIRSRCWVLSWLDHLRSPSCLVVKLTWAPPAVCCWSRHFCCWNPAFFCWLKPSHVTQVAQTVDWESASSKTLGTTRLELSSRRPKTRPETETNPWWNLGIQTT